jgi:hypothetical protein
MLPEKKNVHAGVNLLLAKNQFTTLLDLHQLRVIAIAGAVIMSRIAYVLVSTTAHDIK